MLQVKGEQLPGLQSHTRPPHTGGQEAESQLGLDVREEAAAECGRRGNKGAATHPSGARAGCAATAGSSRPAPRHSFPSGSRRCPEAEPSQPPTLGAAGTRRASPPPGRPPGSRASPGTWRAGRWAKLGTPRKPFGKKSVHSVWAASRAAWATVQGARGRRGWRAGPLEFPLLWASSALPGP